MTFHYFLPMQERYQAAEERVEEVTREIDVSELYSLSH